MCVCESVCVCVCVCVCVSTVCLPSLLSVAYKICIHNSLDFKFTADEAKIYFLFLAKMAKTRNI